MFRPSWLKEPLPAGLNWRFVFLQGSNDEVFNVKESYLSRIVAIARKKRGTAEGIQSASLPSSSTLASEAAPMTDTNTEVGIFTADAHSRCHYVAAFHDGAAVQPAFAVCMKSEKATPRWRYVCFECRHWMTRDELLIKWHELCFSVVPR